MLFWRLTADPWDNILVDKEAETKWNFSLRESLKRSQTQRILQGYNVHLIVNNAADVLKGSKCLIKSIRNLKYFSGAVEACGGRCFTKAPPKSTPGIHVIVSTQENKAKYSRFLKQNPVPMIVAPEAIFDGVLRQELHLEDHLLY